LKSEEIRGAIALMTLPLASSATLLKANLERLNALGDLLDIRPFDKEAAVYYGDVRSELEKKGETIGSNDLLIAAHALSLKRSGPST
jgi:tRNA(fMet)-specific endonuclease VapC